MHFTAAALVAFLVPASPMMPRPHSVFNVRDFGGARPSSRRVCHHAAATTALLRALWAGKFLLGLLPTADCWFCCACRPCSTGRRHQPRHCRGAARAGGRRHRGRALGARRHGEAPWSSRHLPRRRSAGPQRQPCGALGRNGGCAAVALAERLELHGAMASVRATAPPFSSLDDAHWLTG
jgi:hypothetical protein